MVDVFTKAKRSMVMSRIHGRDNATTEMRMVGLLRAAKITGWRRHSLMFGKPDFVFQKSRVAFFVDGCSGTAVQMLSRTRNVRRILEGQSSAMCGVIRRFRASCDHAAGR